MYHKKPLFQPPRVKSREDVTSRGEKQAGASGDVGTVNGPMGDGKGPKIPYMASKETSRASKQIELPKQKPQEIK